MRATARPALLDTCRHSSCLCNLPLITAQYLRSIYSLSIFFFSINTFIQHILFFCLFHSSNHSGFEPILWLLFVLPNLLNMLFLKCEFHSSAVYLSIGLMNIKTDISSLTIEPMLLFFFFVL